MVNSKEIKRIEVMNLLKAKRIKQREAAKRLGLSLRQIKWLWAAYKGYGVAGLVSRQRGKPSNHRLSEEVKRHSIALVKAHYPDFGPTLAQEYLREQHNLQIGANREKIAFLKKIFNLLYNMSKKCV